MQVELLNHTVICRASFNGVVEMMMYHVWRAVRLLTTHGRAWVIVCLAACLVPGRALAVDGIVLTTSQKARGDGYFGSLWRHSMVNSKVTDRRCIYSGECRWPVFNQTGDQIAFQRKDGDKLWISTVSVNGGTPTDIIQNNVGNFFLDWPAGDWIYFNKGFVADPPNGSKDLWRVNVKDKRSERVITFSKLNVAALQGLWHWQMSASANRMAFQTMPFYACVYDFAWNNGVIGTCQAGCSYGISQSGAYWVHNVEGHLTGKIRNFNGTEVKTIRINTAVAWGDHWNWLHFSANSNDWVIYAQGWGGNCDEGMNAAVHNWRTDEVVRATDNQKGKFDFPQDFWIGTPGSTNKVSTPSLGKAYTTKGDSAVVSIQCATQGAIVTYTTNGTDPLPSSVAYAAPFKVALPVTGGVTIKARGFKDGWLPSDIGQLSVTRDTTTAGQTLVVVTSPAAGTALRIGDTLRVRWTTKSPAMTSAVIHLSVDNGKNWMQLSTTTTYPGQPDWGRFDWKIVPAIGTVSLVSPTVIVKVEDYVNPVSGRSGVFTITGPSGIGHLLAPAGVSRSEPRQMLSVGLSGGAHSPGTDRELLLSGRSTPSLSKVENRSDKSRAPGVHLLRGGSSRP